MSTYRAIDVWERKNAHTVVRYRCFESLDTGRYCIQSADFCHHGKTVGELGKSVVELFTEQDPAQRSGEYDTLKAAIAAHKREFGEAAG
jgi:hypothetical protein